MASSFAVLLTRASQSFFLSPWATRQLDGFFGQVAIASLMWPLRIPR